LKGNSVFYPNTVEENAPPTAHAYRFIGEPYRTMAMPRNMENVLILYYQLS